MKVIVAHVSKKIPAGAAVVNACINTPGNEWAGINPFLAGPCPLYSGHTALVMENAWQYSKVYPEHADANGNPTQAYWDWAIKGWALHTGVRFPAGKGRAPLYCWWEGQKLGYIESRKKIYGPVFVKAVQDTPAYARLKNIAETHDVLYIKDWDGWDMDKHGFTSLTEIINQPKKRMGHGFFLKAMLENDPVLELLAL